MLRNVAGIVVKGTDILGNFRNLRQVLCSDVAGVVVERTHILGNFRNLRQILCSDVAGVVVERTHILGNCRNLWQHGLDLFDGDIPHVIHQITEVLRNVGQVGEVVVVAAEKLGLVHDVLRAILILLSPVGG